jgi:hypothetical protein
MRKLKSIRDTSLEVLKSKHIVKTDNGIYQ